LWMVRPFLMPVFWAAVLAVLFHGFYRRYLRVMPGWRNTAALLTVITAVIVVIVPLILLGIAVTNEVIALYQRLTAGVVDVQAPLVWLEEQVPIVAGYLQQYGFEPERVREMIIGTVEVVSEFVARQALVLGQNAATFTAMFFLMLYVLFFFVRDGERIVRLMIRSLPLGDAREARLFDRFVVVSRATVKGTLVVAAVQGAAGGVLLWSVGIQGAVLWAVLMAILALLPVVGTFLVWGPAAIYLITTGSVASGIFVILGGFFVVGLIDNFLRPRLIGRDTAIPDYIVLVATLGGLVKFGLSGFVAGPMLAAFFLVVWDIFAEEFGALDAPGVAPELEPDPDVEGPGTPPIGAEEASPGEVVPVSEEAAE
jgi:predicted PurR-regulated permease PerM